MSPTLIPEIWVLILAVLAIRLGLMIHGVLPKLQQWNIPPAITGGLLIAVGITLVRFGFGVEITFASGIRQMLLLVFFVGVGLSAKFGALLKGGRGVAVICLGIVVVISAQNLIGVGIASVSGLPPGLGLFFGSIPFLGGHGTAAAWAQAAPAEGLCGALEVGMACATLGLIAGGLVAGPVSSWLATRHTSPAMVVADNSAEVPSSHEPHATTADLLSSDRWLVIILIVALCLGLGELLR